MRLFVTQVMVAGTAAATAAATTAATTPTTMPLFGIDGPQVVDVENVLTTSGWFEVMTTGILMASGDLITANISNVNETHASMRLWRSLSSSTPEAAVVTVAKRWWSPQSPYTWPATLYDAFHSLYSDELRLTAMTSGNEATFNASRLFNAVYGQTVMEQCASDVTGQLLLVQHNTETGPVVEAVTRNDITNDTIQHVYQLAGRVEVGESKRSSWWPGCIYFVWRGAKR